ncbi:MAG: flagellar basal body rod protein FlgB [Candidatus Latescibacterota bacterium]|nr:MAG: flagellar basal body rod protein FlgB [Candidatus Latescibacterota bacterium]
MIGRSILGKTSVPILKKIMDVSCLRQKVIARNIANATTPGYREKRVLFETKLRNALSSGQIRGISTDTGHLAIGGNKIDSIQPEVREVGNPPKSGELNNVDIDKEMSNLAQNQLTFYVSARLLAMRIKAIKTSITGKL